MIIKVSVMLPSGPAPEKERVTTFTIDTKTLQLPTVRSFVEELRRNGGLYVNDVYSDWVPLHRVVRVWEGGK